MRTPALPAGAARWLVLLGCLATANAAGAHDFSITRVVALVQADGRFQVDLRVDLDALLLGVAGGHRPDELVQVIERLPEAERTRRLERLRSLFERRVRVRFDGEAARASVTFPDRTEGLLDPQRPSVLGVTARLSGRVPHEARRFTFWASRSFGSVDLLVLDLGTGRSESAVLGAAVESTPFELGAEVETASLPSWPAIAGEYTSLGFLHIVPLGLDHMLFVLALFLVARNVRELLIQVSAFTVAHTLTLALSSLGLIDLPSRLTESMIALSIALVAVEAVLAARRDSGSGPRWLWLVVFGFGLLHGLGFAGAIGDLGLPSGRFVSGLIGFNLGVELGQLAVLGTATVALGWARSKPWYARRVVLPSAFAIAVVGIWWTIERALL